MSFHAAKLFHTIEGGAIIVDDEELTKKLKLLRNFGIKSEEEVILPGTNAKMNEFQAAMGLCNLENIDEKIRHRKIIYNYYKKELAITNVKFQKIIASKYNYGYIPACFENIEMRDKIYSELIKNEIKPRKYFYPLTSDFNYFKNKDIYLYKRDDLKIATDISNRVLCLPLYPDLDIEIVDKIIYIIKRVTEK